MLHNVVNYSECSAAQYMYSALFFIKCCTIQGSIYKEIVYCLSGSFQNGRNSTVFTYITYTARAILVKTSCSVQVQAEFSSYHCREVSFNPMGKFVHFRCLCLPCDHLTFSMFCRWFHNRCSNSNPCKFLISAIFFYFQTAHAFFLCESLSLFCFLFYNHIVHRKTSYYSLLMFLRTYQYLSCCHGLFLLFRCFIADICCLSIFVL